MAIDPATATAAATVAAPVVKDALSKAAQVAESAVKGAIKAIQCKLYPCRCTVEKRSVSFKATWQTLINEAKGAAKAGDYVSAYALADAASELGQVQPFLGYVQSAGSKPPNCTWSTGAALYAQKRSVASALREGYQNLAGSQLQSGSGGFYGVKAAGGVGGALVLGAVVIALILATRGKAKPNGGSNGS